MQLKDTTVVIVKNKYTDAMRAAVDAVYAEFGLDPVCTSGRDALVHKVGSMHPLGRALDIRTWDLLNVIAARIKAQLPTWYEVYVESDHFHLEADVKHEPPEAV